MDLTKLLAMLEGGELRFSRVDLFDDPYEATWPSGMIDALDERMGGPAEIQGRRIRPAQFLIDLAKQDLNSTFVSCWCESDYESAALWKLYLQSSEGVAIRTEFGVIRAELQSSALHIFASRVKYIDFTTREVPNLNGLVPVVRKRKSFSHEQEVRAVIWTGSSHNAELTEHGMSSISVSVHPANLIKAVHISPTAPSWFGKLVQQLMMRYSLDVPVVRSTLYDRPVY